MILRFAAALFLLWPVQTLAHDHVGHDVLCAEVKKYSPSLNSEDVSATGENLNIIEFPIEIPLEMDIQKTRFGGTLPEDIATESVISTLKIHRDGRLEFNGIDVGYDVERFCGGELEGVQSQSVLSRGSSDDILKSRRASESGRIEDQNVGLSAETPAQTPQPVDLPAPIPQKEEPVAQPKPEPTQQNVKGDILEGSAN